MSKPIAPPITSKVPPIALPEESGAFDGVAASGGSSRPFSVASSASSNDKVNFVSVTPWATPRTHRDATTTGSDKVQEKQVFIGARSAITTTATTTMLSPVVITKTSTNTTVSTVTATTTKTTIASATTTTTGGNDLRVLSTNSGVVQKNALTDKAMRLQAKEDLKSSDVIRHRALQRDALLDALFSRNMNAIATVCESFPASAELASYLPIVDHEKLLGTDLGEQAQWYVARGGKDRKVTVYIDWCLRHGHELLAHRTELLGCSSLPKSITPQLIDLCRELRLLKDTVDDASLKKSARIIKKMMVANEDTPALAFAQQPYASTRMMLQKCVLLSRHIEGQTFALFVAKLEQAHQIRKTSTAALQQSLLVKALDAQELREHVLSAYARLLTIPTGALIPQGASLAPLKAMSETLRKLSSVPNMPIMEKTALEGVRNFVRKRIGLSS